MTPADLIKSIDVLKKKQEAIAGDTIKKAKLIALEEFNQGQLMRILAGSELFYIEMFETNGEMIARRDGKKCTGKLTNKSTGYEVSREAKRLSEFEYKIWRYRNA